MRNSEKKLLSQETFQADIFQRLRFANELIEFASVVKTPFSAGLDSAWGSGKSHFIENVLKHAAIKAEIPLVIYNAFENEIEEDPFVSITSQIVQQIKAMSSLGLGETQKQAKLKSLVAATKHVAVTTGTALSKASFNYLFKISVEEFLEEFNLDSDEKAALGKEFIAEVSRKLTSSQSKSKVIEKFKEALKSSAVALSPTHNKIIIVIDELDRCKPSTSLKILETIKHILSAEGIFFLFSYDRAQIESSIKHAYGVLNPDVYLHKFINIDFRFPIAVNNDLGHLLFITEKLKRYGLSEAELEVHDIRKYSVICTILEFSFRHIERALVYFFKYLRVGKKKQECIKYKELFVLSCLVVYKESDLLTFANRRKFDASTISQYLTGTDIRLFRMANEFPEDQDYQKLIDLFRKDKKVLIVTKRERETSHAYAARSTDLRETISEFETSVHNAVRALLSY